MLKKFELFFAIFVTFSGCTKSIHQQGTYYHDDGRSKPIVALIPVFDRSNAEISWNLSEEFTDHMRQRFSKRNNFYLNSPDQINTEIETLGALNNPFTPDVSWVARAFKGEEYVIFTELVEHDLHPKKSKGSFFDKLTPSYELSMTMRIRVFDVRSDIPRVVLQELIHQDHLIPKPSDLSERDPNLWKKRTFFVTPLGLAHVQFAKEIVERIEDYVLLSKSR